MKYLLKKIKPILHIGLLIALYNSINTAQALDVIEPVRTLAAQCSQCHGMEGNNDEGFDNLNGESSAEIYDELLELFDSNDNDLMAHQAKGYTQEQISALADYFSEQPKVTEEDEEDEEDD